MVFMHLSVAEMLRRSSRNEVQRGATRTVGAETVKAERRLDALFSQGQATPETLRAALDRLGALHAALRHAHLAAHLETRPLLTEAQLHRYAQLRGYPTQATGHGHRPHHP
jgi:hypothetical protein